MFKFSEFFDQKAETAESWPQITRFFEKLHRQKTEWIFRGQSSNESPRPVLERTIEEIEGLRLKDAFYLEHALLDRFSRNLATIRPEIPRDLTTVERLALIRHHGGPTRLLDFTYSFYVALYFALENFKGSEPVVWAIDSLWLLKRAKNVLKVDEWGFWPGKREIDFKKYFIQKIPKDRIPAIYQITPYLLNVRLSPQQGTFLCPTDITRTFEKNMASVIEDQPPKKNQIRVIKISKDIRKETLQRLCRMNITRASLFPGLDGFAASLRDSLLFESTIKVYKNKFKDCNE